MIMKLGKKVEFLVYNSLSDEIEKVAEAYIRPPTLIANPKPYKL